MSTTELTLGEAVQILTEDHEHSTERGSGIEPGLLLMLEVAIKSTGTSRSGGSGNRAGSVLDAGALELRDEIARVVGANWPGRGSPKRQATPLPQRLQEWAAVVAGGSNEWALQEFCAYWVAQIRELLDPPRRIPLRGQPCLWCDAETVSLEQDGETVIVPAMLATVGQNPMRVECRACAAEWEGGSILHLGYAALL